MSAIRNMKFSRVLKSDSGATAIEYALLASLIAVAIVVAVSGLGDAVSALFTTTADAF